MSNRLKLFYYVFCIIIFNITFISSFCIRVQTRRIINANTMDLQTYQLALQSAFTLNHLDEEFKLSGVAYVTPESFKSQYSGSVVVSKLPSTRAELIDVKKFYQAVQVPGFVFHSLSMLSAITDYVKNTTINRIQLQYTKITNLEIDKQIALLQQLRM